MGLKRHVKVVKYRSEPAIKRFGEGQLGPVDVSMLFFGEGGSS